MGVTTNSKPRYPDATDPGRCPARHSGVGDRPRRDRLRAIHGARHCARRCRDVRARRRSLARDRLPGRPDRDRVPFAPYFVRGHRYYLHLPLGCKHEPRHICGSRFRQRRAGLRGATADAHRRLTHLPNPRLRDHGRQKSTRILAAAAPILRGHPHPAGIDQTA
jgi:hypothetical protein